MDIYLAVWRKASHYSEQRGAPISWLMTVARSRAIDKLRIVRNMTAAIGLVK
ncbi:MAG TPA: sigma factor [Gammaproteobacteria bacterium]|nr:sigma factor [Gammaproteobacteria bacterium]